jgi:SAM-dependent methyltransferase
VSTAKHWDDAWAGSADDEHSWYQREPATSLRLLRDADPHKRSVVDVGAGTSPLAATLLDEGWESVTVLDISAEAMRDMRTRLVAHAGKVQLVVADVLAWEPERAFDVWHDRAVFHFLTGEDQRRRYVETAANAVRPAGAVVIGTYAEDGPTRCSGLPTARYDPDGLAALFAPHFGPVHSEREGHTTPAGRVLPFTWLVLRRDG